MKKNKTLAVLIPILALVVGFITGQLVSFPPTHESELAGTVGKLSNYRNVKISENDLLLRNELLGDEELASKLQHYFSLHFLNTADLSEKVTSAVAASRSAGDFSTLYGKQVNDLDQLGPFLAEARKDLLLVLSALEDLPESDQQSIGVLINNAANALAQINFREQKVLGFVEAAGAFLDEKGTVNFPELVRAHDLLLLGQVRSALLSDDNLKLKVLDGKSLLSRGDSLPGQFSPEGDQLRKLALTDMQGLGDLVSDKEKVFACLDVELLGIMSKPGPLGIVMDRDKLGIVMDRDKLGIMSKPGSLGIVMDRDRLNDFLNKSALGISADRNP